VRTVYKWLARQPTGGRQALETRLSAPARPARMIGAWWTDAAARPRRGDRMTAAEIAERPALARSTVARWLTRMGLGRRPNLDPKPPVVRYRANDPAN